MTYITFLSSNSFLQPLIYWATVAYGKRKNMIWGWGQTHSHFSFLLLAKCFMYMGMSGFYGAPRDSLKGFPWHALNRKMWLVRAAGHIAFSEATPTSSTVDKYDSRESWNQTAKVTTLGPFHHFSKAKIPWQ